MRKQFVDCLTRELAEEACPLAAEVIEADGGYWCVESAQDAETYKAQA